MNKFVSSANNLTVDFVIQFRMSFIYTVSQKTGPFFISITLVNTVRF